MHASRPGARASLMLPCARVGASSRPVHAYTHAYERRHTYTSTHTRVHIHMHTSTHAFPMCKICALARVQAPYMHACPAEAQGMMQPVPS